MCDWCLIEGARHVSTACNRTKSVLLLQHLHNFPFLTANSWGSSSYPESGNSNYMQEWVSRTVRKAKTACFVLNGKHSALLLDQAFIRCLDKLRIWESVIKPIHKPQY